MTDDTARVDARYTGCHEPQSNPHEVHSDKENTRSFFVALARRLGQLVGKEIARRADGRSSDRKHP